MAETLTRRNRVKVARTQRESIERWTHPDGVEHGTVGIGDIIRRPNEHTKYKVVEIYRQPSGWVVDVRCPVTGGLRTFRVTDVRVVKAA